MLEDWTLGTLLRQVREEFGLADQEDINRKITDKVNQAIGWLVARKQSWPWMRTEFVLDVKQSSTGVGSFTKGSLGVVLTSGSIELRDVVLVSDSPTDATSGYLVTDSSSINLTLQSQYRGETVAGAAFQIQKGFFRLPDDFIRLVGTSDLSAINVSSLKYTPPAQFDILKRERNVSSLVQRYYTVKPDPIGLDGNFYLAVFPYMASLSTLQGEYFRIPPKLQNNADRPIVSRQDSTILLYVAFWLFSISESSDRSSIYESQAITLIEAASKEYNLSSDLNTSPTPFEPDWVQGPATFPRFDD